MRCGPSFLFLHILLHGTPFVTALRCRSWTECCPVLQDLDSQDRVDYMMAGARLAVLPMIAENSPYAIQECIVSSLANHPWLRDRSRCADRLNTALEMLLSPLIDIVVPPLKVDVGDAPVLCRLQLFPFLQPMLGVWLNY